MGDIKKRVAVFASYNKDNRIPDYVVYYLTALRKVVDGIVFVSDNELGTDEQDILSDLVTVAICRRHGMYDFGSYRIGYFWALEHRMLDDADELVFVNDSCFGPVCPFEDVFRKMDGRECDFWGLTDSYEITHHIQSFFLVFRKNVFTSVPFHNFVSCFTKQESYWDYVNLYERKFTMVLENSGYRSAVYIDIDKDTRDVLSFRSGNGNLTLFPVFLHEHGMPLVKVKALNGGFGRDLKESPRLLMQKIKEVNTDLHDIITRELCKSGVRHDDMWYTPEEIVSGAEVVSFDIFDTLLSRPYIKPVDLFRHIESATGMDGFAEKRVRAERHARRKHKDLADISLEQIYAELDKKYRHLQQEELCFERELLSSKTDAKVIYDEAVKQGKTIIAVSDMYLPQGFLEEVLREKGYMDISRVFVSNGENCCKSDGSLFRRVLQAMDVVPEKIVHIGDNPDADKKAPELLGIRAFYRPSEVENMFNNPAMLKFKSFACKTPCLETSVLTAMFARHCATAVMSSSFEEFGYYLGGPLAVGYCMHIHKVAKERGNDAILFVSRDGYALHKVYQKLFPDDIPSYYIYASRKIILRSFVDYKNEFYLQNVCEIYAKECLPDVVITKDNFEQYREGLEQWAANNAKCYQAYLDSMHITGKKMMSVDMTTKAYTSLYMLHHVFGDRIDCGMFSISYGDPCTYTALSYAEKVWREDDLPLIILQEELITAPEYSAISVDSGGHIVFAAHNPVEDYRIEKYKDILKGIDEFTCDFMRLMGNRKLGLSFSFELWNSLYHAYIGHSNFGDQELLKSVYHDDIGFQSYDNLWSICIKKEAGVNVDWKRVYRKNRKHLKAIRLLTVVLCIETAVVIFLLLLSL